MTFFVFTTIILTDRMLCGPQILSQSKVWLQLVYPHTRLVSQLLLSSENGRFLWETVEIYRSSAVHPCFRRWHGSTTCSRLPGQLEGPGGRHMAGHDSGWSGDTRVSLESHTGQSGSSRSAALAGIAQIPRGGSPPRNDMSPPGTPALK